MISHLTALIVVHLRVITRDRVLHAIFGVALALLVLVPTLSSFSMRQVQELAITLSLSAISLVLLVLTLVLGASSIWRDVERRYTTSILTLPTTRAAYVLSKYFCVVLFLVFVALLLGLASVLVIVPSAASYPSDIPIHWVNLLFCLIGIVLKYCLLAAFAILLSSLSTSFYLPFFGTLVLYLCGNASQEVYEYASSQFGQGLHPFSVFALKCVYYIVPNLSSFDFQVQAIYGIAISWEDLFLPAIYFVIYTGLLLCLSVFSFNRRELP